MLHSRSAAAGKALLRAMLLRISLPVALAAEPPSASPTQPAAVKSSLSPSCARLDGRARSLLAGVRESPREPEEEGGESGRLRGGGGGAGGRGDGGDARLAEQEMPARTARPTAPGLNTAREEEREGRARVRCERGVARPSRPPLGGAWGRARGRRGSARRPRPRRRARARARAKGARGVRGCGAGRRERPLGRHSPLPPAWRGKAGGKHGELTRAA